MRLAALFLLCATATAAAGPVSYALRGDVAVGEKPQIRITANEATSDVKVEVDRDDGKHFVIKAGALAKGKVVTLDIGDGVAGKATYKGTISGTAGGKKWSEEIGFDTKVRAPIKVSYDAEHLDLDKRTLQFKLSRTAQTANIIAIGEDGKELGKGSLTFSTEAPDTWIPITWTQPADKRVMMLKLKISGDDGTTTNVELIPWSVTVDHEDVTFPTDSAKIEASEEAKLDASLAKIAEIVKQSEKFLKLQLYIAGHTDTVGPNAKNRKLSLDRARAIAAYFRRKGLALPIAFAGFGEEVLNVATPDNTDERRNRRADYVLGPVGGSPPFKGPYLKVKAGWAALK